MNNLRRCRYQNIDGPCIRVRMRSFEVNDILIFRGFEFGHMRVYGRGFPWLRMNVEKWGIKRRDKKRRNCAAGRQLSHGVILMNKSFEVNPHELTAPAAGRSCRQPHRTRCTVVEGRRCP